MNRGFFLVLVAFRSCVISSASISGSRKASAQSPRVEILPQFFRPSKPHSSRPLTCAVALDQAYSTARSTSPARAGFRST